MNGSVTVTYNPNKECFYKQLKSIKSQLDCCVVIDNGSRNNDEITELCNYFDIELITLDKNYGLAFAQNMGINHVIEKGCEYILLLDQDSILNNDFITNMLTIYNKYKVGILGASFYDPITNKTYPGTSYIGPFIERIDIQELTPVTFVIASGSFFSAKVYNDIGGMKDELFVDYIDVEWSLRAKKLGYVVAMTNKASMAHTIGDARINIFGRTISVHSPIRRYYLVRNSLYMVRLSYVPFGYKIREVFFNFIRAAISLAINKDKKETVIKVFQGIYDGFRNNYGSYDGR